MRLEDLLRGSAHRHSSSVAIAHGPLTINYKSLLSRAEAIAGTLRARGVASGDRVLIYCAKSIDAIAAMHAVLMAGAIYVPVDSRMPALRVQQIIDDCAPTLCLCDESTLDLGRRMIACVEFTEAASQDTPTIEPLQDATADDLAYILYTSGSTGAPKGVAITHRNALAFVEWASHELRSTSADRLSSHAPFTFDLSVWDIYGAMYAGASVHLIDTDYAYSPARLIQFMVEQGITIWYSVPSALAMVVEGGLLQEQCPSLRVFMVAGEPCPVQLLRRLRNWSPARLLNLYGPTETNVCTFREVTDGDLERDAPPPIGQACSGDQVSVRTPEGDVYVPGAVGELVVSGPTVMPGYWSRDPQGQQYRTGDLVRIREDGALDYVGRIDNMVKIRGHRVELGDVEASVRAHPAVTDAAAQVVGDGPTASLVVDVCGGPLSLLELKAHCAARLPRYMIPDQVRHLDQLPRTFNGKVDRKALQS